VVALHSARKIARRMLAQHGIAAIWDTHVGAAAAYGLGNPDIAASLIEIAEAAESEWLQPSLRNEECAGRSGP